MNIRYYGTCTDCGHEVEVDFDEDSGAPVCMECDSYEIERDSIDSEIDDEEFDDEIELALVPGDEEAETVYDDF